MKLKETRDSLSLPGLPASATASHPLCCVSLCWHVRSRSGQGPFKSHHRPAAVPNLLEPFFEGNAQVLHPSMHRHKDIAHRHTGVPAVQTAWVVPGEV